MRGRWIRLAILGSVVLALGSVLNAHAETVYEHFNDYGDIQDELVGKGSAAGGWAGPWGHVPSPEFYPGIRLTYSDPNYNNDLNAGDADDGAAGVIMGGGVNSGQVATRSFATPLTGTVWVSALARFTTDVMAAPRTGETLLWFNENIDPGGSDFIAFRNGGDNSSEGTLRYNETNQATSESFAVDTVHLMLARLEVQVGGNDSIEFWINPDLSGGEAGIGAADLSASGFDTFGDGLDSIGVSFAFNGSFIDAIRVSNDADGFTKVISPSIAPLLGDYNDDGNVDAADYTVWRDNLDSTTANLPNDSTPDSVSLADYTVWKNNFGGPGGSGTGLSAPVPEPSVGGLVLIVLLGIAAGKRSARRRTE